MPSATSSNARGAALLLGAALCGFDAGMIGYVLPAMRADLGVDALMASWLVTLYVAGTLAAIPLAGFAVRRLGGTAVFAACAAVAAAGAAGAFLARDPAAIAAARAVQGLGMGPLLPVAAAIVAMQWPAERQGRAMGYISLAYGVFYLGATGIAPWVLSLGWRAVFAFSALAALAALAASRALGAARIVLATPTLEAVQGSRTMLAVAALSLGTGVGQAAVTYFPSLAVTRLGVTPSQAALLMLPLVVAGLAATLAVTVWLDRVGAKAILAGGAALTLAGVALAAFAPPGRLAFLAGAALLGTGICALCGGPLRYAAARAVAARDQGPAQAAVALSTNVGLLAASLVLGAIGGRAGDAISAIQVAFAVACAFMAAAFVPVVALRR